MIPALFVGGRQQLAVCASEAPAPRNTPEFRLEVVRCAGAFFANRAWYSVADGTR
jgi:hypothetical protein